MIQIRRKQLQGEFPKHISAAIQNELKGEYIPIIASVRREYWNKLGLPAPSDIAAPQPPAPLAGISAGELFLTKSGSLCYFKVSPGRDSLECGFLTREGSPEEFNDFFESLKNVLQRELKSKEGIWTSLTSDDALSTLPSRGKAIKLVKEETAVARELEDPSLLALLSRARGSSSLSARDITALEDRSTMENLLEKLVRLGLMSKDFVVMCKEKGQQIIKVASKQAIEETSQKGLKCFLCGKPISEENVEEVLSITALGRRMIDKGYWMQVRILQALSKIGFSSQEVASDEEDDFYSLYFPGPDKPVMMAMFDRKLSITDAYTLNAKLSVNQAGVGILISNQPISPISQEFLLQSNPGRGLHFLDSFGGIEDKLEQILQSQQQEEIRKIVEPFSSLTPVALRDLICQKVFGNGSSEPKKSPPSKRSREN